MAVQTGSRIGPYEIESALGAGGMGEVYRARDTRLNRRVAIKSLPTAFAQDPERVARFRREAQLLSSFESSAYRWYSRSRGVERLTVSGARIRGWGKPGGS